MTELFNNIPSHISLELDEDDYFSVRHSVPYTSQEKDMGDRYWNRRGCGISCVKMCLDYFVKGSADSVENMAKQGKLDEGFTEATGWKHDYEIELLKDRGLDSWQIDKREPKLISKIADHINSGGLVIASLRGTFLEQEYFHQVVLTGVKYKDYRRQNNGVVGFYYNDPDFLTEDKGSNRYLDIGQFISHFRRLCIFVEKNNSTYFNKKEEGYRKRRWQKWKFQ